MTSRWLLLAGALLGSSCSCQTDEPASDGPDASVGGGSSGGAGTGGAGGAFDAQGPDAGECPPLSPPPDVPAHWKRFPGLPCKCDDVWVSPEPASMDPPPVWITTPPGVLELEHNWGDPARRIFSGSAVGGAHQGTQHVSFRRGVAKDVYELVTIRLPDNVPVFHARQYDKVCSLRARSISNGSALHLGWERSPGLTERAVGLFVTTDDGSTSTVHWELSGTIIQGFALSSDIAAWIRAPNTQIDVFPRSGGAPVFGAWVSSGITTQESSLVASGSALFFSPRTVTWSEVWVWTPGQEARAFIARQGDAPGQVGSACGLGTDGKTLVWTQASGYTGGKYEKVELMTAPFTSDPAALKPVKLRDAPGPGTACKPWLVSGGLAATWEDVGDGSGGTLALPVIVRLSDGVLWTVPRRDIRRWGYPLYITDTEIALEEGMPNQHDAGVLPYFSWSIVRYPLALLGPGEPP